MRLGTKKFILGTKKCSQNEQKSGGKKIIKFKKGVVSLQRLISTTRFKYRYDGKVYYLTVPAKKQIAPQVLEEVRKGIEYDILFKIHDNSQVKYKNWLQQMSIHLSKNFEFPKHSQILDLNYSDVNIVLPSLDILMIEYMNITGRSNAINLYHYTYRMIVNWLKQGLAVEWNLLPKLLCEMNYAAETYNNRRYVLNLFCSWLVKRKGVSFNPFDEVAAKKKSSIKDPRRKRLSDTEIQKILQAIKNNTFLKKNNRGYTHSHYFPIFTFLAYTGCRPAEAIGLKVSKIDFENNIILIDSAFGRTRKGTSFSCRIMKNTKTNSSRELPLNKNHFLHGILMNAIHGKKSDDFVFHGPNSPTCDDRAMNDSVLKNVCKGLKIQRRILYCFRHSFCSRCFEQGVDIKTIQALTGHKDVSILLNIYAEVHTGIRKLPDLIL